MFFGIARPHNCPHSGLQVGGNQIDRSRRLDAGDVSGNTGSGTQEWAHLQIDGVLHAEAFI